VLGNLLSAATTPIRRRRKARTLLGYGRRNGLRTLVETGTYRGHTVAACSGHFDRIYSIELHPGLYEQARHRFAGDPSVTLVQGDSCEALMRLGPEIEGPALFWLDAHHSSGGTAKGAHDPPLEWELRAVLERGEPDVVLIDDARLLGRDGWPSLEDVRRLLAGRAGELEVRDDIVRIALTPTATPPSAAPRS
jgi:hypothetical protein